MLVNVQSFQHSFMHSSENKNQPHASTTKAKNPGSCSNKISQRNPWASALGGTQVQPKQGGCRHGSPPPTPQIQGHVQTREISVMHGRRSGEKRKCSRNKGEPWESTTNAAIPRSCSNKGSQRSPWASALENAQVQPKQGKCNHGTQ